MNVLSLFDGMSCGRIALDRAGLPVTNYYASEIDKYAIRVSKANWPDIEQVGDVTKLESWYFPKIDLLIGGSPCQGFSFAGKQLNFSDPRSKLFFEFVRLLKQLRERNPKIKFLLENVVMKKEYQDVISEALGVKPVLLDSTHFSAASRKRLYWTNIPSLPLPTGSTQTVNDIAVPQLEVPAEKYLKRSYKHLLLKEVEKSRFSELIKNKRTTSPSTEKPVLVSKIENDTPSGISRQADRLYCSFSKSPCLTAFGTGYLKFNFGNHPDTWRTLTRTEAERLQTVPDDYTLCVTENNAFTMLGNGWNVDTIVHLFQGLKCDWF